MDEKSYRKYIRKRGYGRTKAKYGWSRLSVTSAFFAAIGALLAWIIDTQFRGLSSATGELWAYVIYIIIGGAIGFAVQYLLTYRAEPYLLYKEQELEITGLEKQLADKYNNTNILVEGHRYERTTKDQWVGLKITNQENVGIADFYVSLTSSIDESDGRDDLPAPIKIDWSSLNPPSHDFRLPREDTRFFDVAATHLDNTPNTATYVMIGGIHRFRVGWGERKLTFKIGGQINGADIKPIVCSADLIYSGGVSLEIVNVERIQDEEEGTKSKE